MGRKTLYKVGTEAIEKSKVVKVVKEDVVKEVAPQQITSLPNEYENMTEAQIAKLVEDFSKKDPYSLKGLNPSFRYRFINRNGEKLDRQTMRGWQIVNGAEAEKIAKETKITTRQGQIIVGDGVLAKIPMQLHTAIKAKLQDLNRRTIGESSSTLRRDMGKYPRNVEESLKVRDKGNREIELINK